MAFVSMEFSVMRSSENAAPSISRDFARLNVNFSAPVVPGDELEIEIWFEGDDLAFQVHAPARQSIVSKGGRATLRAAASTH